ncbi:SET domain-containing protein-lysine N-methyltransferase [Nonomuraea sp. NPDC049758]|uniref:SET domain-containing protein n=1 Tax=Nonomuraea sp. NPDC049758 TaxID=3154360 RepID=UPI003424110A
MTSPAYPHQSWLTPRARVTLSPIHGTGLFAGERIGEGEVVMRLGGRLIDNDTLASLTPPYSSLTIEEGLHLLLDPDHPVRYGNHSCEPNLWHTDATTLVARREIAPGEELTVDYATHSGVGTWSMPCRCAAPGCRGAVTGDDWRLPHLQHTYGAHWSPPLLNRINQEQPRT